MTFHYGCEESCLMRNIGLLRWGVSQASPESDLLQLSYFLGILFRPWRLR